MIFQPASISALYRAHLDHEAKFSTEMTHNQTENWSEQSWAIKDEIMQCKVSEPADLAIKIAVILQDDMELTEEQIVILRADAKKVLEMPI